MTALKELLLGIALVALIGIAGFLYQNTKHVDLHQTATTTQAQ